MNVEIKYRLKQYKGETNIFYSLSLGYLHEEITSPSFYSIKKNEGIKLIAHSLRPPLFFLMVFSLSITMHFQ